jgi:hypothetical protein
MGEPSTELLQSHPVRHCEVATASRPLFGEAVLGRGNLMLPSRGLLRCARNDSPRGLSMGFAAAVEPSTNSCITSVVIFSAGLPVNSM